MQSDNFAMILLFRIILLVAVTLFLSALFTPPIFTGIESLLGKEPWPYSRVFDRVAMVVALVLILGFRSFFHLGTLRQEVLPYLSQKKLYPLLSGSLLSFLVSLALIFVIVAGGTLTWSDRSQSVLIWKFTKAIPAALLIAFIEELFFRFFLFVSLRKYMSFLKAASISSVLYALLHFIQPVKTWKLLDPSIFS